EALAFEAPPPPSPPPLGGGGGDRLLPNLSPKKRKIFDVVAGGAGRRAAGVAGLGGWTPAGVQGRGDKGLLQIVELHSAAPCRHPHIRDFELSMDQRGVAKRLCEAMQVGGFHAALIDGVTGAGKTEVYFEAINEALKQDKQVLLLLPE